MLHNIFEYLTFEDPMVAICTTYFNKHQLSILPTECILGFLMFLSVNRDYYPEQH
jgi:hypothetical protein